MHENKKNHAAVPFDTAAAARFYRPFPGGSQRCWATVFASLRRLTSSFCRIWLTWVLTVASLISRIWPISALLRSAHKRRSTCCSVAVSAPQPGRPASAGSQDNRPPECGPHQDGLQKAASFTQSHFSNSGKIAAPKLLTGRM